MHHFLRPKYTIHLWLWYSFQRLHHCNELNRLGKYFSGYWIGQLQESDHWPLIWTLDFKQALYFQPKSDVTFVHHLSHACQAGNTSRQGDGSQQFLPALRGYTITADLCSYLVVISYLCHCVNYCVKYSAKHREPVPGLCTWVELGVTLTRW